MVGEKKKKKDSSFIGNAHKRTHIGSHWAVIEYKSYMGDGPLSETPRNNSSSAHTHTTPSASTHTR